MPRQSVTNRQTLNWLQNLFQRSNEFSNAYWTKDQVSISANQIANPIDGAIDASLLTDNAVVGSHRMYGGLLSMVSGNFYSHSIYVKNNDRRYFALTEDTAAGFACVLDLQLGTITSSTFSTSKYFSVTFNVLPLSNGWYRLNSVFLPKQSTNVFVAYSLCNTNSTTGLNYGGTGLSVYIYHAQLVRANWPGFLTVTTASANTTPIRNIVASRIAVSNRSPI